VLNIDYIVTSIFYQYSPILSNLYTQSSVMEKNHIINQQAIITK